MSAGHIVSTATGTTALTGSTWSSMITLYTNAAFPDASRIYERNIATLRGLESFRAGR